MTSSKGQDFEARKLLLETLKEISNAKSRNQTALYVTPSLPRTGA